MIELDIECSPASASLDLKRVDRLCHALENRQELMSQVRKHLNLRPPQHDRVKLPTLADRFNHTRNVSKSTSKFFTTGRNVPPGCERDVTKEKNPFSRCKDTDLLQKVFMHTENRNQAPDSCFIQKHCMNPCICRYPNAETKKCTSQSKKRTSWESAHSSFQVMNKGSNAATPKCPPEINPICARLYVPDVPIPPSKTDLDPEYFNVARGRPVKETFNRHDFSRIQKTVFFQKLFAGFLDDEVKKRQEHHRLDMWELTNISRELDRMKATQEEFANQSHSESVNIVTEQMAISKIREKREEELLRCKGYVNIIKSSLYKKDDMLSTSMYCRDILLQLSPTKFRNAYEEEVQAYRKETSQLANQAITIFSEYCRYNPDPEPDLFLNELVHTFVKQLLSLGPPKIYFKSKWQIDMVFREMELHCMEQMDDLQRMNRLEDEIDGIVHDVKKFYHTQSSLVTQEIDAFRSNSEYQTQRSLDLETETNFLMSTSFKDTVSGDVYLETLALVEVLYSYVLGPSNSKFDGPEMMLQIEEELRDVDIQIREMGKAQYLICEKKVEKRMAKEIKEAQLAKKQDRAVRGGIARVRKMYLRPPYGHGWRKVIPRSPPLLRNGKVPRPEEVKRKESKRLYKHLQLEGICDRDDVEAEIDELLTNFLARRRQQSSKDTAEDDSIVEERSSLRSSVSSDALNMAIQLFESQEEEEKSEKSLSLVQLGYDSEEELLRKNYEMRKRRGEDIPEPDVLYEIKSIDSKFMVSPEERKPPMKDRRHVHRPEPTLKPTNPLSWR